MKNAKSLESDVAQPGRRSKRVVIRGVIGIISPYFVLTLFAFFFRVVSVPPKRSEHAAEDGVHRRGNRARHRDQRIGKVCGGENDAERRVLHANFDAHRSRGLTRESSGAGQEVSQTEPERMQQGDGGDERRSRGENLSRRATDDAS